MNNFGVKIAGVLFVVMFCFIILIIVDFMQIKSLSDANERLKNEKYELIQKLEKVEKEKLNCVLGFNKGE